MTSYPSVFARIGQTIYGDRGRAENFDREVRRLTQVAATLVSGSPCLTMEHQHIVQGIRKALGENFSLAMFSDKRLGKSDAYGFGLMATYSCGSTAHILFAPWLEGLDTVDLGNATKHMAAALATVMGTARDIYICYVSPQKIIPDVGHAELQGYIVFGVGSPTLAQWKPRFLEQILQVPAVAPTDESGLVSADPSVEVRDRSPEDLISIVQGLAVSVSQLRGEVGRIGQQVGAMHQSINPRGGLEPIRVTLETINQELASIRELIAGGEGVGLGGNTDEPMLTFSIDKLKNFPWKEHGLAVVESDNDGVSMIRCVKTGNVYKRRAPTNKYDPAIFFSRASGKKEDGTPIYVRRIIFKQFKPVEPVPEKLTRYSAPQSATPGRN